MIYPRVYTVAVGNIQLECFNATDVYRICPVG